MNIASLPINKLHQLRLAKEIKTQEIVASCIEQIKLHENEINAYISQNLDWAMQAAELADKEINAGKKIDYLTGMPIAIKDIYNIKDTITTCGSKILQNYKSPYDATAISKLRNLGCGFIGKTNLDEFAMGSSTEHSAFKITKNPWNLNFVPGGSSGGSAAAVAANMCVGALGTDTGGSIRQPASFCGVVGLKPTYGTVSRFGMVPYGSSLDQGGPIAKDVTDAAIIYERISGYDPQDSTSINKPASEVLSDISKGVNKLKIGVIADLDLSSCSLDVKNSFNQVCDFYKNSGVEIVPVSIENFKHAVSTYYVIAMAEASSNLGRYDGIRYGLRKEKEKLLDLYEESRSDGFGEEVKLRILLGTFVLSAGYYDAYYNKAKRVQQLLKKQFKQAFSKVDAIALPVVPTTAFKIGQSTANPVLTYLTDAFTVPANLSGIPGISVPAGIGENNLPIGFQLLADHFAEPTLLKLAYHLEQNFAKNIKKSPF